MHAVILAGGAGTRLRPLTYARRKELIPLLNRPLLEYRLRNLRDHGVRDIVIACAAGTVELEEAFGDGSALGINLRFNYETQMLGSGRAVKDAARAAGAAGTLVVCNGDILTEIDLTAMIDQHRRTSAAMSISLAAVHEPWHFGVVDLDTDCLIRRFIEKPPQGEEPSNLINSGTWLWEPEILERIPDDESAVRDQFSERVLFPGVIAEGLRVQGFVEDFWIDVGAPDRYLQATAMMLARTGVQVADDARVDAKATVTPPMCIGSRSLVAAGASVRAATLGPGTRIGRDASVSESILWEGVDVGDGAMVERSILGARVRIGARARVRDAVLADDATVADGCELPDGARLDPGERAG